MDWLQIDGKEIPLLEAPQKYENPPRRILYVIFKHKKLIRNVFLLLIVPMVLYLLSRPTEYTAISKVLIKPSRAFLNVSPNARGGDDGFKHVAFPRDAQHGGADHQEPSGCRARG